MTKAAEGTVEHTSWNSNRRGHFLYVPDIFCNGFGHVTGQQQPPGSCMYEFSRMTKAAEGAYTYSRAYKLEFKSSGNFLYVPDIFCNGYGHVTGQQQPPGSCMYEFSKMTKAAEGAYTYSRAYK